MLSCLCKRQEAMCRCPLLRGLNDAMVAADEAEMHAIGDHEQRQVGQLGTPSA